MKLETLLKHQGRLQTQSHGYMRTKIAVNLLNNCICDHDDIDEDNDSVNFVGQFRWW